MTSNIEALQVQLNNLSSSVDEHMVSLSEDILNLNETILLQKSQIINLEAKDEEHTAAILNLEESFISLESRLQDEIDAVKTNLEAIEAQMENFIGIEQFECSICEATFVRKSNMNLHIKVVHEEMELFKCLRH